MSEDAGMSEVVFIACVASRCGNKGALYTAHISEEIVCPVCGATMQEVHDLPEADAEYKAKIEMGLSGRQSLGDQ
jgi:ribosomal protein S27E